mgnify:CR=1 FL=1|tara:strand:+ start:594 stop:872 length:279 start_codon:yes stop_codon:yes gene_type:complete
MKKKKINVKRPRSKKGDDKPLNVSTMQGDAAPDTSPNEIHVGGNHLYYEEEKKKKNKKKREILKGMDLLKKRITYADFRQKSNEVKYGRNSI